MTDEDARGLSAVLVANVPELREPPDRLRRVSQRIRGRRRRKVAGIIALGAIVVAGAPMLTSRAPAPVTEPATPAATSMTSVDWTRATLVLPANAATPCPTGRRQLRPKHEVRWHAELGEVSGDTRVGRRTFQILDSPVMLGDLTGDGSPEALLHVRCTEFPDGYLGDEEGAQLLAVTMREDHSLVGLGYVGQVHAKYLTYRIADGHVLAGLSYNVITRSHRGYTRYDLAHVRKYSWNGKKFTQVAGRTQALSLTPSKDMISSPLRLPAILRGSTVLCPAATVRLQFGEATVGGYTYSIAERGNVQIVDVDKDGNDEALVSLRCSGNGYDAKSLYLLGQGADEFVVRDVPLANDGRYVVRDVAFEGTTLRAQVTVDGVARTLTMPWAGGRFSARVGRSVP